MNKLKLTLVLFASLLLGGCSTFGDDRVASQKLLLERQQVVIDPPARRENIGPYASKFALMALFSKVVYRKDLPKATRNELECSYLRSGDVPTVGIPTDSGWSRWAHKDGCVFDDGLALEVYLHAGSKGVPDKAVIAYRGTEHFSFGAAMEDWRANVAAAFRLEPRQYRLAQRHLDSAIPELLRLNHEIQIYATGHSLGGGLAQQAGYYSDKVLEVFAFDPSPVTNWMALEKRERIANPDPVIYRIYHRNEALAYLRNVTSKFNSRRFGRHDFEFYFQDVKEGVGGAVASHEMGILACHLAANIEGATAEHGLTKKSALELLNESYRTPPSKPPYDVHPICPTDVVLSKSIFEQKQANAQQTGEAGEVTAAR